MPMMPRGKFLPSACYYEQPSIEGLWVPYREASAQLLGLSVKDLPEDKLFQVFS